MFIQEALAYRLESLVWFLLDILPPAVMIVLWLAAFRERDQIGGYSLGAMLLYYLATGVFTTLLTTHPEWNTAYEIRMGEFSRLLLKPLSPHVYIFIGDMAWKLMRLILLMPVVLVALGLLLGRLDWPALRAEHVLGLAFIIPISLLMQFAIKLTLGYMAFWLSEPSGLYGLFGTVLAFLGGAIVPLDLMPEGLVRVSGWLPFHYFYFFPAQLLLGRLEGAEILWGSLVAAVWCAGSIAVLLAVYRTGIRDYAAVGG